MEQVPEIVRVEVLRVVFDESLEAPVVILKEVDGDRILPIWIGHPEATAIVYALEEIDIERPLTHDLLKTVIETFGGKVEKIVVNKLVSNTFYARIIVRKDSTLFSIDARPSDSIALALRTGAPIYVAEEVMERSSARGNF
ncbi:MAG: bifunctional nuclease family protein [Candidatus Hydrothermota bacterium]|uniref:Bifunctional nuclease family protein n=1 Tax=candidate division WOR-3 bacterium TaxID=2052148 RepID=A0A7C1BFH7_UNCW3|nr:MAG: bifunctional nuclease family protein [Candidatus Hydrothermae bacterium]RKZ04250.1 MAG: bifunctional nuclease family protein [Candidatus Hydrothermae bacterium]HDM89828.1 bifunctional nuclease family protein [candidate division WOR-3 bacterium]